MKASGNMKPSSIYCIIGSLTTKLVHPPGFSGEVVGYTPRGLKIKFVKVQMKLLVRPMIIY